MVLLQTITYATFVDGQEQTSDLSARTPVSNVTDGSRNLSSFEMASKLTGKNQEPNQGFLYLATQLAVGGAIAGLALFGANMLLDEVRKPRLRLEEGYMPEPVDIDLSVYTTHNPQYRAELSTFKIKYKVNRIAIRNKGRNAAKGCKAVLNRNGREEKVCWSVPSERYLMTLNAKSLEFVDVCAAIVGDQAEHLKNVLRNIKALEDEVVKISELSQRFDMFRIKNFVSTHYKDKEDIPKIIAPTENGWQSPHFNRKLEPGPAEIMITAENAKPILIRIEILEDVNSNGRIIKLLNNRKILAFDTKKLKKPKQL